MDPNEREGVTKYRVSHTDSPLPKQWARALQSLLPARAELRGRGWVGQESSRYGGVGFGNVSIRVGPNGRPKGERGFLVSGTQTSQLVTVDEASFAWIQAYDVRRNWVRSQGPCAPSSESMTHGTLYDIDPQIRVVLHVHWPGGWQARFRLRLPTTPTDVAYGTPQMARATQDLFENTDVATRRVYAMGGHLDGLVSFGQTAEEALAVLLNIERQLELG